VESKSVYRLPRSRAYATEVIAKQGQGLRVRSFYQSKEDIVEYGDLAWVEAMDVSHK
jgi:hypothetical protein